MSDTSKPSGGAELPPHVQMMQLAQGHMRTQAIVAATRLGIADALAEGPKSAEDIARATGAHAGAVYRLLRALASLGVFAEDDAGRFALTPLAVPLQRDVPNSIRPMVLLIGEEFHWGAWSNLFHSVTTGECAFEHVKGRPFFDYLAQHPESSASFDAWMTRVSELQTPAILASYDFSAYPVVVDIGGGHGRLLAAILKAHLGVRGVLFDRPDVAEAARAIHDAGVGERCEVRGGSFFETAPRGGDLYVMKTVLHDWSDDLCVEILRNCRKAMTDAARLLVIEFIVPAGNAPHPSKFMDLNMLVLNHGGRERTEPEFCDLFARAGFTLTRVVPTPAAISLIEAAPI